MHVSRKKTFYFLSVLIMIACFFTGCSDSKKSPKNENITQSEKENTEFNDYLDDCFVKTMNTDSITRHFTLKDPDSYHLEKLEPTLGNLDLSLGKDSSQLQSFYDQLLSFSPETLSKQQKFYYDNLKKYFENQLEISKYYYFQNTLNADKGVAASTPLTLSEYNFYTEQDIKDYLCLLTKIDAYFDSAFAFEQSKIEKGVSMSDFAIEDTIAQIDYFLAKKSTNILTETFEQRIENVDFLSEDQKKSYIKNNQYLLETTVYPAFSKLRSNLLTLKGNGGRERGLAHYENGSAYYDALLRYMTCSDKTTDQMIQAIEKRLALLIKNVQKVYIKYPKAYDLLKEDAAPKQSAIEILDSLQNIILEDYPSIDAVKYSVNEIPTALMDQTTAAYYMTPPIDDTALNKIYYNSNKEESFTFFTTLAHEGYPGHLYQTNYYLNSPAFEPYISTLNFTGYQEGWAFYVQIDLCNYLNFHLNDAEFENAMVKLYQYNQEFGYAVSSLVDLYVNAKDADEAEIGKLLKNYGLSDTSAKSFYEYAVESPGTYLQYYIGYLELLSMKKELEKAKGASYSVKDFHKDILDAGPCYYSVLKNSLNL